MKTYIKLDERKYFRYNFGVGMLIRENVNQIEDDPSFGRNFLVLAKNSVKQS